MTGAVEPVPFPRPRPERRPEQRNPEQRSGAHAKPPPEPTPWATGLTISACFAVIVAIADTALSKAFADAFGLLWLPANLLVGAGLAPSLWLGRHTPFWRWPAYGVAAGLVVAWVCLLFGLLGGVSSLAGVR